MEVKYMKLIFGVLDTNLSILPLDFWIDWEENNTCLGL